MIAAASLALAGGAAAADAGPYPAGIAKRALSPGGDFDWRGSHRRGLAVTVWYPASKDAVEAPLLAPPDAPMWNAGSAAPGAALATGRVRFPLVVLSHGTGGSAFQLGWLGTALARQGIVAAAVDHPGNSAVDGYTVEGFVLRWERARDLHVAIDGLLADPVFGPALDAGRIGAAGFSLGGYTVFELAGARTDLAAFRRSCGEHPADCAPPPEFPDLDRRIEEKAAHEPAFRAALERAGASFRDERVRAIFAIAPAVGHSFTPAELSAIRIPTLIVVGDKDTIAPPDANARYYARHTPGARLEVLPGAGHYTFLDLPTELALREKPLFASDAPGVSRAEVHARVAALAAEFFATQLR